MDSCSWSIDDHFLIHFVCFCRVLKHGTMAVFNSLYLFVWVLFRSHLIVQNLPINVTNHCQTWIASCQMAVKAIFQNCSMRSKISQIYESWTARKDASRRIRSKWNSNSFPASSLSITSFTCCPRNKFWRLKSMIDRLGQSDYFRWSIMKCQPIIVTWVNSFFQSHLSSIQIRDYQPFLSKPSCNDVLRKTL